MPGANSVGGVGSGDELRGRLGFRGEDTLEDATPRVAARQAAELTVPWAAEAPLWQVKAERIDVEKGKLGFVMFTPMDFTVGWLESLRVPASARKAP